MQRRSFLQSVALASGSALINPLGGMAFAAESEQRFGDLLIRNRATDHFELIFTPKQPRPLRLMQLADTHFRVGDDTTPATEKTLRRLIESEKPDFIIHTGDFVNNDSKTVVFCFIFKRFTDDISFLRAQKILKP